LEIDGRKRKIKWAFGVDKVTKEKVRIERYGTAGSNGQDE